MEKIEPARSVSPAGSAVLRTAGRFAIWLLAASAVSAQVYPPGGYPGGGYPPGGYPGGYPGSGPSIPLGRSKTNPNTSTKGQPLPNFRGKLQQMDNKTITITLDDDRQLDFRRNDKTKFFKNGEEVKDPKFAPGDQLSVEGPEDEKGYLIAVNVYWEKAAGAQTAATKDKDAGAVDTWKDNPKSATPAGAQAAASATEMTPPPAKPDADDPGPPVLHRGKPADAAREHAPEPPPQPLAQAGTAGNAQPVAAPQAETTEAAVTPPAPVYRDADEAAVPEARPQHGDDLIRRAAGAAFDFTEGLPNYVCQEQMARFASQTRPADWRAIDLVSAAVIYENGKEDYRDIKVNGKPRQSFADTDGAWSTGEFGTLLIDLFSPATDAQFRFRQTDRIAGVNARVYDYTVDHSHSHWNLTVSSQHYMPAYRGAVWIDPQTARVLRIEERAYDLPSSFPSDHVESATDYEYVQLGDARKYLLPVHSETLMCQRGSDMCDRNTIDFRNYHKYTGESTITFGDTKKQ
ncbi:MAG: hypothetical protein ABSH00_09160 [Bryobacteraceae bacterium]|jgi:hypothetical protein